MHSTSLVTAAYRSPFDGEVDPGLPPWKRDLILRRRAISRTLGSPVPGILDVASILAMSRASSGATSLTSVRGTAGLLNGLSQQQQQDRARNSIKPAPADPLTNDVADGRDEEAKMSSEQTTSSNSWATTGGGGRPMIAHERTHARQVKRPHHEEDGKEEGITKPESTDGNGYYGVSTSNRSANGAAAGAAATTDRPLTASSVVGPSRGPPSDFRRSNNFRLSGETDDSSPDESTLFVVAVDANRASYPPAIMKADIATSNSLASTSTTRGGGWRGCETKFQRYSSDSGIGARGSKIRNGGEMQPASVAIDSYVDSAVENGTPDHVQAPSVLPNRRSIKKFFSADLTPGNSSLLRKRGSVSSSSSSDFNDSEYEYGPGFVNKLRTKFINLTLKQQKDPLRPTLRRVASLEDILDKEDPVPQPPRPSSTLTNGVKKTGVEAGSAKPVPVRRELLKARSMETLLAVSSQDEEEVSKEQDQVDATLTTSDNKTGGVVVQREFPPPDTVKSIKKLYEPNSPRPRKAPPQAKMNYKNTLQRNVNVPKATPRPRLEVGTFAAQNDQTSPIKPELPAKSPFLMKNKPNVGPKPPVVPKPPVTVNGGFESKIVNKFHAVQAEVRDVETDSSSDSSEERFKSDDEEEDVITTVKRVSIKAVENIRAGGTSVQFNFKASETVSKHLPNSKMATTSAVKPQPRQIGVIRPITKFEETNNRINRELTVKGIAEKKEQHVKKDVVDAAPRAPPHADNKTTFKREAAKNASDSPSTSLTVTFGSKKPDPSPPVIAKPAVVVDEKPAPVVEIKKPEPAVVSKPATTPAQTAAAANKWHQQQNNTLQFNFSKREFVPDYVENDGMDLSKRSARLADPGVIRIGGVGGESGTDEDDLILARLTIRPPSPCNVEFINANIIVSGKSSLRKSTSKSKGRLSFNDSATTTFEYPSERSLLDEGLAERLIQTTNSAYGESSTDSQSSAMLHRINDDDDPTRMAGGNNRSFPGTVAAVGSGSSQLGGLASYTPSKIPMGTTFELGVTRTVAMSSSSTANNHHLSSSSSSTLSNKDEPSTDYLKEASTGETFTQAGITADLLF